MSRPKTMTAHSQENPLAAHSRFKRTIDLARTRIDENNRTSYKSVEHVLNLAKCAREKNRSEGHLFNPLFFFRISETKHSQLLGWLLSPQETHGQGNLFLVSFLKLLNVPAPESGEWHVTMERDRIDILIRRIEPPSVIIIENKSNEACDQGNQLYRYWYRAIHEPFRRFGIDYTDSEVKKSFQLVYLPNSEHKLPAPHSTLRPETGDNAISKVDADEHDKLPLKTKILSFNREIAEWLKDISKEVPQTNTRLNTYLQFYTELCQTL